MARHAEHPEVSHRTWQVQSRSQSRFAGRRYHTYMSSLQVPAVPALEEVIALVEGSGGATRSGRANGTFLAPDVQSWLAGPEDGLTAAIESVRGAEATADALARLAPSSLSIVASVHTDDACWAEIARGGEELETCIAGLTYDAAGRVSRLVWLRAPLVPARKGDADRPVPNGRPILERYFADLISSRFREAAGHFTVDTLYSHPPYAGGTEWVLFRGREALWRAFVTLRGPSPARQVITDFWQQGDRAFVEGVIEGIPHGGTYFATGQISPGGEIARYVAFYVGERIPRR